MVSYILNDLKLHKKHSKSQSLKGQNTNYYENNTKQ